MQKAILDDFPNADIAVSMVWIHMLPTDNEQVAVRAAQTILDPRVRHFHDPNQRAGKFIASSLGGVGKIAWDIYLFFAQGTEWREQIPMPMDWAHQLKGSDWAEADHFHWDDDLECELRRMMEHLGTTGG